MSALPPDDQPPEKGPRESLKSIIARKKKEMENNLESNFHRLAILDDAYANSENTNYITRGVTGVISDLKVQGHYNIWDRNHPERPQRLAKILKRCEEKGLFRYCVEIAATPIRDLRMKILRKHSVEHYDKLRTICHERSIPTLEAAASNYDSVYFNSNTFDAAFRAVAATLNLITAMKSGEILNGMAFVRPPGHHAMDSEFNGYCFFNNVAIAAESAIVDHNYSRVLIVDFDVHHGQGIQQMFYNRRDVLYFSIHRYEHGTFWPNLLESNFNYIGEGEGLGYNINVPLNATGLTDSDYLAIILNILLPVGYEFNPDLIIVAAGYDAAVGCPEGKMNVTPGFYAHLISLLSGLARGKIAVVLEGGYYLETLAEGAALTLKSLMGGPCPLLEPAVHVHPSVMETICNVRRMLQDKWNCFKVCELQESDEVGSSAGTDDVHRCEIGYYGMANVPPFPTRFCYPDNTSQDLLHFRDLSIELQQGYNAPMDLPVYYVYDDLLLRHTPRPGDNERPERPERLTAIIKVFTDFCLTTRVHRLPIISTDFSAYNPHCPDYIDSIATMEQTADLYINEHTRDAVFLSVCGLLTLTEAVVMGKARSGVAVIRPPGHHAEQDKAMGYCFMNNVAIAANYLRLRHNLQRILIIDFDIHHGNGTQNMFYESREVMYISIHKDEDGKFFPANSPRNYTYDGHGLGKGYNINIPFNKDKMGDTEYIAAFQNIVLPAAYAFGPQIVIVSAGFDAGVNDPLGGYLVHPETFGHLIWMLRALAEGRIVLALEGGYNLTTTSYSMGICTKALLGDPIIMPRSVYSNFSDEAVKTIRAVSQHFKQHHNIFKVNKKLAKTPVLVKTVQNWSEDMYEEELTRALDAQRIDDNGYVEQEMKKFFEE